MKLFSAVLVAMLTMGAVFAAEQPAAAAVTEEAAVAAAPAENYGWTFIAFAFGTDLPSDAATTSVYGVKVGVPASGGPAPVYGVEASVLWAGTDSVDGVQCSLIATESEALNGLQLALVNFGKQVAGLQLGIVNFSKDSAFQIGLLNHIENSCVPWMPFINCKF